MKYVGRESQLARIKASLQNKEHSSRIAIIGERGIGKSHLLEEIGRYARDDLTHATAYVSIDRSITPDLFAARLLLSLATSLKLGKWQAIRKQISEVSSVGSVFFSVEVSKKPGAHGALEDLCFTLINGFREKEIAEEIDAVTLFIDEVDAADNDLFPVGACLKTIIEYLDFHGVHQVNMVIAGLPSMRETIYLTHPSAWREFENIHIIQLSEVEASSLIDAILTQRSEHFDNEIKINSDARAHILEISSGYPHWIRELTEAAIEHAVAIGESSSLRLTRDYVGRGKPIAFQRAWENYYSSDFESLDGSAKLLLRLMAVHSGDRVRLDLLYRVSGLSENQFNEIIDSVVDANIISIEDEGLYQVAEMRSIAYRFRLSQIMHPLLDPVGLNSFWDDAERALYRFKIAGEQGAPTFDAFCSLVADQFEDDRVEFLEYDSTSSLFDSMREPSQITGFRAECSESLRNARQLLPPARDIAEVPSGGDPFLPEPRVFRKAKSRDASSVKIRPFLPSAKFSDVWNHADVLCVPHYMLGRVSSLGVWTFDELLGERCDELREYFEFVLHDFEESCTFESHWVATPFTYLTKVLVSKDDIETPDTWEILASEDGAISAKIDRGPHSIALWYEWRQHLVEQEDWPIFFTRTHSDELPRVSEQAILAMKQLNNIQKQGPEGALELAEKCNPFFLTLRRFRRLLLATDAVTRSLTEEKGGTRKSYWGNYQKFVESDARMMSMWIDWAASLSDLCSKSSDCDLRWYDLPALPGVEERSRLRQPIESWVFVIPRKASSRNHKFRATKMAEFLISTLSSGWQLQFQELGGCSPLAWLVNL